MKKILVTVLVSTLALVTFAKMPVGFKYSETNKDTIKKWIADTTTTKSLFDDVTLNTLLLIADVNPTKVSYTDFKTKVLTNPLTTEIINKAKAANATKYETTLANTKKNVFVLILMYDKNLISYAKYAIEDADVLNHNVFTRTSFTWPAFKDVIGANKATFRKIFKLCVEANVKADKPKQIQAALDIYKDKMIDTKFGLTKEEMEEDLRFAKILIFPNISKSDDWKQTAVKAELLLKAIQ